MSPERQCNTLLVLLSFSFHSVPSLSTSLTPIQLWFETNRGKWRRMELITNSRILHVVRFSLHLDIVPFASVCYLSFQSSDHPFRKVNSYHITPRKTHSDSLFSFLGGLRSNQQFLQKCWTAPVIWSYPEMFSQNWPWFIVRNLQPHKTGLAAIKCRATDLAAQRRETKKSYNLANLWKWHDY